MASVYNPENHRRRSIRLRGYDYSSSGAYFVTVCIKNKESLFGEIVDGMMRLNHAGELIHEIWDALPKRYDDIDLDAFVVMPNHVHGIIVLTETPAVGAGLALPSRKGAARKLSQNSQNDFHRSTNTLTLCPSPKGRGNGATATSGSLSLWERVGVRETKHMRVQIVARLGPCSEY